MIKGSILEVTAIKAADKHLALKEKSYEYSERVGTTKDSAKTREPSLSLIFKSITQLKAVVRIEYWHTHLAAKRLQAAIKKVNKTCSDIGEQISVLEEISELLESEMGLIKAQEVSQEYRLTDVMLKLKEFENQQWRNSLRVLGMAQGAEGIDICSFMLTLLKGAFLEST
ncbi:hypothetical protein NDU88_001936 [Pleurodeles waltl]|uniref:Uncharacterized protein n=1 Tax=Pleurodeles waltl TaxID=8319 RepID=A0AAV7P887_PLEWA|nr:hypothetical protein NDU88_001936 [Pleurodeles waltl]